ncbi:uncharacterized protein LOC102708608 isoform X2 [Oryza brachyantha]|uniref:uncharacterized protein LOC102708608 isoform X2 n=1 Tax=Oryza brachyantha TaxID=4533 RepID=UPI001ADD2636|nr:uncharacterized protein LOC102708608 isoform X2 [Oryza brachyantha]
MEATTTTGLLARPVTARLSAACLLPVDGSAGARRRARVAVAAAAGRSSNSSSYVVVPLDAAPSGITRPLVEILRDLNKRVPDSVVRSSRRASPSGSDPVIPWYHVNRMLSFYAPVSGQRTGGEVWEWHKMVEKLELVLWKEKTNFEWHIRLVWRGPRHYLH